jgi:glycerophosphoryl diester phosphodiesterase
MPFDGFSQADFAQKMIDELVMYNVPPEDVWQQSGLAEDGQYWIENAATATKLSPWTEDSRPRSGDLDWMSRNPSDWWQVHCPSHVKLVEASLTSRAPGQLDMIRT